MCCFSCTLLQRDGLDVFIARMLHDATNKVERVSSTVTEEVFVIRGDCRDLVVKGELVVKVIHPRLPRGPPEFSYSLYFQNK